MKRLSDFRKDQRGSVMGMTAMLTPLIMFSVLASVDISTKMKTGHIVQRYADASALMAARAVAAEYTAGDADIDALEAMGETYGKSAFASQIKRFNLKDVSDTEISFQLDDEANEVVTTLKYTGEMETIFTILGFDKANLKVETEVRVPVRQRIEIHFLIDNSPSMNVGASARDQQIMMNFSGCAFACHRSNTSWRFSPDVNRDMGAKLRIDVVKDALAAAMDQLQLLPKHKVEAYVAGHTFSNNITTVLEQTNDLEDAADKLGDIDTIDADYGTHTIGEGGTHYKRALSQLATKLADADTARTGPPPAIRFVVLLTDGVQTQHNWTSSTEHKSIATIDWTPFAPFWNSWRGGVTVAGTQGLDPATCNPIKALTNTEMVVMELEYLPAGRTNIHPHDIFIRDNIMPQIPANAKACASDKDYVYSANDEAEVRATINKLLGDIIRSIRTRVSE